jgi:hypothetical protein
MLHIAASCGSLNVLVNLVKIICIGTFQAIENLKDEMLNNVESYRITMDDILQTNIHDIGFQYDEAGSLTVCLNHDYAMFFKCT